MATQEEFARVQTHLELLSQGIPKMKEAAGKYLDTVGKIASDQKANNLILQQHAQIIEFLEIPQLLLSLSSSLTSLEQPPQPDLTSPTSTPQPRFLLNLQPRSLFRLCHVLLRPSRSAQGSRPCYRHL